MAYSRLFAWIAYFYPRSPCGERLRNAEAVSKYMIFLSTLSLRRATCQGQTGSAGYLHFYPRSPCGERPVSKYMMKYINKFLSTLSLRRATSAELRVFQVDKISIHALLAESDETLSVSVCSAGLISIHALLAESDGVSGLPGRLY